MKKTIITGFICFFFISLLAACGAQKESTSGESDTAKDKTILKMATSADFPPFESYDTDGSFIGFDVELAQAIADELGYELQIEDMDFDGLIGALQANRVDMVLAGMSATEDRQKNVNFSTEYHRSGEMFISKPDDEIKDIEDLSGKVVGVQLGTIQEEGAEALAAEYGFEVKKVDDASILIQELNSNRIDVAYMDKTVATGYIDSQGFVGFDDPTTSSPGMAIAFPKNSEIVEEVNAALAKFEEDGTMEKLKEEWLSEIE
jgi:arginine/lysine/histidine transporter system substrate-binding protein